jgi:hypothetical protein
MPRFRSGTKKPFQLRRKITQVLSEREAARRLARPLRKRLKEKFALSRTLLYLPISSATLTVGLLCAVFAMPLATDTPTIRGPIDQCIRDRTGAPITNPALARSPNPNNFGIAAQEIHALLPLNLSEGDGATDVHGSVTDQSYTSQSRVPERSTLIFAEEALLTMGRHMKGTARRLRTRFAREFQTGQTRMLRIAQLLSRCVWTRSEPEEGIQRI